RGRFVMWLNILAIPACLLGIVFTGSRGGAICAAAGLLLVPLTYSRLRPVAQGVIVLAVILIASLTYVVAPAFEQRMPSGLPRFTGISSQVRTGDLTGRGRIWLAGLDAIRARPVVGSGAGTYATAVEPYLGEARTAHNAFINVLAEDGGIGLALF